MTIHVYTVHVFFFSMPGAHTNSIECEWRHAKNFVRRRCYNGTSDGVKLQRMLFVWMWFRWLGQPYPSGASVRILHDISRMYRLWLIVHKYKCIFLSNLCQNVVYITSVAISFIQAHCWTLMYNVSTWRLSHITLPTWDLHFLGLEAL